jgi:hypothetical protein
MESMTAQHGERVLMVGVASSTVSCTRAEKRLEQAQAQV